MILNALEQHLASSGKISRTTSSSTTSTDTNIVVQHPSPYNTLPVRAPQLYRNEFALLLHCLIGTTLNLWESEAWLLMMQMLWDMLIHMHGQCDWAYSFNDWDDRIYRLVHGSSFTPSTVVEALTTVQCLSPPPSESTKSLRMVQSHKHYHRRSSATTLGI